MADKEVTDPLTASIESVTQNATVEDAGAIKTGSPSHDLESFHLQLVERVSLLEKIVAEFKAKRCGCNTFLGWFSNTNILEADSHHFCSNRRAASDAGMGVDAQMIAVGEGHGGLKAEVWEDNDHYQSYVGGGGDCWNWEKQELNISVEDYLIKWDL
ncbi:hypothetical protein QYF36_010633 [Acer negundo]|nr:hypothetical protein QYF36_010633 [Acer negundo]